MITVGNKQRGARGIYVGRPSPLGNPFAMQGDATRAQVIRDYEDWLAEQLLDPSSPASREIHRLAALARKQDLCLVCWCAPKACHADIIKRTIEAINRAWSTKLVSESVALLPVARFFLSLADLPY
jgi:hypothetical protein